MQLSVEIVVQARDSQECPASPFRLLNTPNPSVLEKCHLKVLSKQTQTPLCNICRVTIGANSPTL